MNRRNRRYQYRRQTGSNQDQAVDKSPVIVTTPAPVFEEEKFYDPETDKVETVELHRTEHTVVMIGTPSDDSHEKVKMMPQTYVEDTFDIEHTDIKDPVVIDNPVRVKEKVFITEEDLLKNFAFNDKLTRYKRDIEYSKTFACLFDLSTFSKMNRDFFITDTIDEVDILIRELVVHYRRRLSKIITNYEEYQKFDTFFRSLQSIYNRFKHSEYAAKDDLKTELEQLKEMDGVIAVRIFSRVQPKEW